MSKRNTTEGVVSQQTAYDGVHVSRNTANKNRNPLVCFSFGHGGECGSVFLFFFRLLLVAIPFVFWGCVRTWKNQWLVDLFLFFHPHKASSFFLCTLHRSPHVRISPKGKPCNYVYTVYDWVYHTPGDNILGFGIFSHGVVYRVGVVYTVPPVIMWVVVWDFRLFTTPGGIP